MSAQNLSKIYCQICSPFSGLLVRMWRKGNPFALLVEMQICAATVESSIEISQKIKNGPCDPVIPLLGIYPKKPKKLIQNNKQHYVHCSIIYNH